MQDGKDLPNLQEEMARKQACKAREELCLPVLHGKRVPEEAREWIENGLYLNSVSTVKQK